MGFTGTASLTVTALQRETMHELKKKEKRHGFKFTVTMRPTGMFEQQYSKAFTCANQQTDIQVRANMSPPARRDGRTMAHTGQPCVATNRERS